MRAREFISETDHKKAKLAQRFQQPSTGLNLYYDGPVEYVSDYTQYRLGLALACSDGESSFEFDPNSWHGRNKSIHPYTPEEQKMVNQTFKIIGVKHKDLNDGDLKSQELESTYKVSPINDWRKSK
jgi:hypothetical protein